MSQPVIRVRVKVGVKRVVARLTFRVKSIAGMHHQPEIQYKVNVRVRFSVRFRLRVSVRVGLGVELRLGL